MFFLVSLGIAIVPGFSASASGGTGCCSATAAPSVSTDPQFGTDVGFFVFKLPFLSQVVDWVFGFLVVTAILVAVVHYLTGASASSPWASG